MINQLTTEQESLITVYREKWRNIALSTQPVNRDKAIKTAELAYYLLGKLVPEIVFLESPNQFNNNFLKIEVHNLIEKSLVKQVQVQINLPLKEKISSQINTELFKKIRGKIYYPFGGISMRLLMSISENNFLSWNDLHSIKRWVYYATCIDYCISVLGCKYQHHLWEFLLALAHECPWFFPYNHVCIICDRPLHIRFDNQNQLHAEGEPAIEFADGYSIYSYHGVTLPEKYGKVHPQRWRSQWLLTETNAELRRVLIQSIGYARICQELQAVELDNWAEYTLLQIDNSIDVEPIFLLKMTCPSTGFVHILRVPPKTKSAREAICWVNWGVDPQDFSIQT
ncbi:DUF6745 domain-containing protein [Nostoc sp. MS1]|uniref:DUF6745 domain-containing protein n=1 Tax=Nostoc sp. MS1 TaxID=2764711 RepID=UPI001CC80A2B|nr:hypothetical protein [Nostoc sp. MS1]BCL36900.1 hypothetical protein NSMS1_33470 [Nostoc sp. MS1]